ncbi:hypothetical protein D3C78_1592530 [compost metagenome]
MTKQTAACLLVISANAEAARYRLDAVDDFVVFFVLDETGLHVDDTMAATCVKTADQAAVRYTNRNLRFVTIAPGFSHSERRQHGNGMVICRAVVQILVPLLGDPQLPDPLQRVHNMLSFPCKLTLIA